MRKWISVLGALLLLFPAAALGEVVEGVTVSAAEQQVLAQATGVLERLGLTVGGCVAAYEEVGQIRPTRVYATQDGIIAGVEAAAGETVDGTVLTLEPTCRYVVYCVLDHAYDSPETKIVHSGETVYMRCTANGTHWATGRVTFVGGGEYTVEVDGGELYVGETVYVYRSPDFAATTRVGIGTAVSGAVESYEATGTLLEVRVRPGDAVQRGQLLYTFAEGTGTGVTSPVDGVVTGVYAAQGSRVQEGDVLAGVTAWQDIQLELVVGEDTALRLRVGDRVTYTRGTDPAEAPRTGRIVSVDAMSGEAGYVVRVQPDEREARIGMTVEVTLGET